MDENDQVAAACIVPETAIADEEDKNGELPLQ
jgi:hypothetical protein